MLRRGDPTKGLAKSAADGLATGKAIGCSQELVEAPGEVQEGAGLHATCLPCEQRMALETTLSSSWVEMTSQDYLEPYKMCMIIMMADTMQFLTPSLPVPLTQSRASLGAEIPLDQRHSQGAELSVAI